MKRFSYFLLDLDGTLILGNRALKGARSFIKFLKSNNKKFLILTNNSSRSTAEYARLLKRKGFDINENEIFTSGLATAIYSKEVGLKDAYILGTKSVIDEFREFGISHNSKSKNLILTFDTTLNFRKLSKATKILLNSGGKYIASHPDNVCPVEDGFIPDVGAMIAFFKEATGRSPDFIPGKPSYYFYKKAMELLNAVKEETIIIGDRLSTDIKTGLDFGITSILVLTGETTIYDLRESNLQPDFVFNDLVEVRRFLEGK
ncbi:MAG: HAD-IIA family hydrolase [candidate division WOR-3 bacterium]